MMCLGLVGRKSADEEGTLGTATINVKKIPHNGRG